MAVYKQDIVDIEMNSGSVHRSFLKHALGSDDVKADRFGVRLFRDGEPMDLTGVSVQGFFRNSAGTNIAITSGNMVSGNTAAVVLPQACYGVPGPFSLAIKLVGDGITGTMRIVDGVVEETHITNAVAPTGMVPSYQEVLAAYDAAVAATADAITDNGRVASGDWNSLTAAQRFYYTTGDAESWDNGPPLSAAMIGVVFTAASRIIQIAANNQGTFLRVSADGGSTWYAWRSLNPFALAVSGTTSANGTLQISALDITKHRIVSIVPSTNVIALPVRWSSADLSKWGISFRKYTDYSALANTEVSATVYYEYI